MLSNKELNPIVTKLFIRGRKLNISLAFIKQSYFAVPKNIRLNSTKSVLKNHILFWLLILLLLQIILYVLERIF